MVMRRGATNHEASRYFAILETNAYRTRFMGEPRQRVLLFVKSWDESRGARRLSCEYVHWPDPSTSADSISASSAAANINAGGDISSAAVSLAKGFSAAAIVMV